MEIWIRKESRPREQYSVFNIREDDIISPETGRQYTFHIIEADDWVNVVPITEDGQIVCVRQYRHGTGEITLETPGGVVDKGELPENTARRELLEETGYEAESIAHIGTVTPNPAIQNNRCHFYLANGCKRVAEQDLDGAELIDVVLVDPADIPQLILNGEINHALVVAAFYYLEQKNGRER